MNEHQIDFLRLLCFEGGISGVIAIDDDRNLVKYLAGKALIRQEKAADIIYFFETQKFIVTEKNKKGRIVKIRLCVTSADVERLPKDGVRIFLVFIDWLNIERGISDRNERQSRMKDLSWLYAPILEKGKIAFMYIFVSDATVPEISPIYAASKMRIPIIICPRKTVGGIMKDADTVDMHLIEMARNHIAYSNITDIVIVSGDADFSPIVGSALLSRVGVTIVSATSALSGRFLDMEMRKEIEIVRV